jgi:hypothetical protein
MINPMNKSKKTQPFVTQQLKATPLSAPQQIQDIPPRRSSASSAPSHEEIARRAYEIYIEKGYPQDQSEQIWQQAEQEIRDRNMATFLTR